MSVSDNNQQAEQYEQPLANAKGRDVNDERLLKRVLNRLAEARDRLVDRNLRNKLINTSLKSSRTRSLRIWDELSDQIFECLVAHKINMTFQHVISAEDTTDPAADTDSLLELSEDSELVLPEDPDRHSDTALQTKLSGKNLEKKLRALHYEAIDYEEEQGVNILYLALGFLKWFEDANSEVERFAPLVLLPVELSREGARNRYKLKIRDEDLFTNVSLKIWLQEQHSIELPEIPEADSWRPSDYFDQVRSAVSKAKRWEVIDNEILLGFFSFSKFLLWRDLDPDNWPKGQGLVDHPIMQKLLSTSAESETILPEPPIVPPDELIDDHFTPHDLVYVLDADCSQTEAIQTSLTGKSLVIQGPPGTGKSQTITNIIAATIHQGKKVLFIAEKMAALNVVHQRLQQSGLSPLCFELHSRKASKSSVLNQLRGSVELANQQIDSTEPIKLLSRAQKTLNDHAKRLNTTIAPWGFSPFEVLGAISKLSRDGVAPSIYIIPNANNYTRESLEELEEKLHELVERLQISGAPNRHPWRFSRKSMLNPLDATRLQGLLRDEVKIVNQLIDIAKIVSISIGFSADFATTASVAELKRLTEIRDILILAPDVNVDLIKSGLLRKEHQKIPLIVEKIEGFNSLAEELNVQFINGWVKHNFSALRLKFAGSAGSLFSIFNKTYRESLAELKGLMVGKLPKGFASRLALIDKACNAIEQKREIESFSPTIVQELRNIWVAEKSDISSLRSIAEWHVRTLILSDKEFDVLVRFLENPSISKQIEVLKQLLEKHRELARELSELASVAEFSESFHLQKEVNLLNIWANSIDKFNEWPPVRERLAELKHVLGIDIHNAIYEGNIQASEIIRLVRITILEKVWQSMVERLPELVSLDGTQLDNTLAQFRSLDKTRLSLASKEVLSSYAAKKPRGYAGDMAIIRQELNKKKSHLPVRKLLNKSGRAIQELKPVFLMSPMSLAQYVAPGSLMFDLLLIDEASQVRPEDALGAIARAKQVVVVGDDKQLPPTNFFNRLTDEEVVLEEDDEGVALSNLESILSLCNIAIPNQCMLRWHYRSHHPGLIAVSNRNFYDNQLLLPPSTLRESYADGMGVSFIKSPENSYERGGANGGRNVVEAEMIAKEVIKFAQKYPKKSLGVAAFSVRQRDAIRDMVDNYRRKHPELESFFSESREEHFFIRNLESIQGDQRDVIFISVGYGRDQNGRLTQTFGPLAQEGGERRLNVLISRAKDRCTVFSSITADDIRPASGSLGISAFREFLQYAEKGYFDAPILTDRDFDSDFEESVAIFLRKHGYKLQPQVGMAGFLIDIGVIDPRNENRFLCGVECDGATYHSSRSARDRDRLRQSILEERGWKIYRIWSTDWFHRRSVQEQRLLDFLHGLVEYRPSDADSGITPNIERYQVTDGISEVESVSIVDKIRPEGNEEIYYVEFNEVANTRLMPHELSSSQLASIVTKIVELEGPIHESEVGRRVSKSFGLERAGDRIQRATKDALKAASLTEDAGFWAVVGQSTANVRNRSRVQSRTLLQATNLPPKEIEIGIAKIVRDSVRVAEDDLISHTSRLFGFDRCGPDIRVAIAEVLHRSTIFDTDHSGLYIIRV